MCEGAPDVQGQEEQGAMGSGTPGPCPVPLAGVAQALAPALAGLFCHPQQLR